MTTVPFLAFQHYSIESLEAVREKLIRGSRRWNTPLLLICTPIRVANGSNMILVDGSEVELNGLPSMHALAIEALRQPIHRFSPTGTGVYYEGLYRVRSYDFAGDDLRLAVVPWSRPDAEGGESLGKPFESDEPNHPSSRQVGNVDSSSTQEHFVFLKEVRAWLSQHGLEPRSPSVDEPLYDVAWADRGIRIVAEVKTSNALNSLQQIYRGVGQVLFYAFQTRARPVLFVCEPLSYEQLSYVTSLGIVVVHRFELAYRPPSSFFGPNWLGVPFEP